ncbi:MAG: hypothetical protein DMF68_03310 [Acidobacteria bacterium]|nr:MAG: hypothetical protein DMF68_03310 [Acidobacteriota bacterium]
MIALRLLLLVLLLCFVLPVRMSQAQGNADSTTADVDESAISVEERRRTLTELSTAARQFLDNGQTLEAARALNRVGRLQLSLNSLQDALAAYREALTILKQIPDPSTNISSLNGLGKTYSRMGKCADAQTFLRRAITLSEQNSYQDGRAEALLTLSACQNFDDHALALKTAEEALALWQSIGSKRGIAESYMTVGDYQFAQSNLPEATQDYEAALNLWRELNDMDEQADALIQLGFIEYRKGAWQNVFTFLTQAQGLVNEKANPYRMGQITSGLAETFVESGLPETGIDKYREALEYYHQSQDRRASIVTLWAIGKAYYVLGNNPEAVRNLQQALADAESIKESTIVAMCNDFLGRSFGAMGDATSAQSHFEVALDLYTRVKNPMEAARVRALLGRIYQQQGKVETARNYYQKALETFRALSDRVNQSATLYALGVLELRQNNLNVAEDYFSQAIEATEQMRRSSTSRDLTAAFSDTVQERYESYIDCLMRRNRMEPEDGFAVRAFEISESARGRSLAELLRATQTDILPGIEPQLAEQEKSLRQSLRVKDDYKVAMLGRSYKKEELDALESELARLEADYKQVTETIRARYPSFNQITQPLAWDLKQIQEKVINDDQTVFLEYSLGEDRSYVWAITHNSIRSYELPPRSQINAAAGKVYKLLASPPAVQTESELTGATNELAEMVLSPVDAELNKRKVIVAADGALNYIPFQILPAPSTNNQPLISSHEIINAPSATILGELQQQAERREPPAKVLAAFGDPIFESDHAQRHDANGEQLAMRSLEAVRLRQALRDIELNGDAFDPSVIKRLFYARRELANLRDVAPERSTFIAAEYDATREQLQKADLTQYAILHFATHGLLDPKRPENSGLLLSTVKPDGQTQSGFVGLQDIYALHAPVELVVLSACQTALGKDVRGEGLLGLTRGFMYAGASSVVASLWKVDDEATAELMRQFYINMLQKEMTPAAALRAAQNSIRQKPEWRSPYYWAAFTLQGENHMLIKPAQIAGWATLRWKIALALALMALATFIVLRHRRNKLLRAKEEG